jgi:hypothetical protein
MIGNSGAVYGHLLSFGLRMLEKICVIVPAWSSKGPFLGQTCGLDAETNLGAHSLA